MSDEPVEDDHYFVVKGRRWRRTDPCLDDDVVEALTSHLGRGRSGVRVARNQGDDAAVKASRRRTDLAKHGLGERGPKWWEDEPGARRARAREALEQLEALDD